MPWTPDYSQYTALQGCMGRWVGDVRWVLLGGWAHRGRASWRQLSPFPVRWPRY